MIAISRQTYSSIETKRRKMSWGIFLSLILVFDNNVKTHSYIREMGVFPRSLIKDDKSFEGSEISALNRSIYSGLDSQAVHTIETIIRVEFARCNNANAELVIEGVRRGAEDFDTSNS